MAQEVQPYDFEPEYADHELNELQVQADDNNGEVAEDGANGPPPVQDRAGQAAYWCLCGVCIPLPTSVECQCCCEFEKVMERRDSLGVNQGMVFPRIDDT